jgi:hypothetical protein
VRRHAFKRILNESRSFDPKAIAILLEAFDGVVAELSLRAPAENVRAAKLIIRVALGQEDLDVELLCSRPERGEHAVEFLLKLWSDSASPRKRMRFAGRPKPPA